MVSLQATWQPEKVLVANLVLETEPPQLTIEGKFTERDDGFPPFWTREGDDLVHVLGRFSKSRAVVREV
jgi:hypothetical protein